MTAETRTALALMIGVAVMGGCTPVVVRSSNTATKAPATSTTPALAGTVKDATGAPVDGALVAAVSWKESDSPTPAALVRSDRAGRFAINSLPAGRYSLTATAAGREGGFAGNIDVAPGQTRPGELVLGNGGVRLSGSVVDITGKPLSSLLVSFSRSSDKRGDVWFAYADERGHAGDSRRRARRERSVALGATAPETVPFPMMILGVAPGATADRNDTF
jgi:hypothetical protein